MGEYYGNNDWRDYQSLKHYGVKGMKWGRGRKARVIMGKNGKLLYLYNNPNEQSVSRMPSTGSSTRPLKRKKKVTESSTGGVKRGDRIKVQRDYELAKKHPKIYKAKKRTEQILQNLGKRAYEKRLSRRYNKSAGNKPTNLRTLTKRIKRYRKYSGDTRPLWEP